MRFIFMDEAGTSAQEPVVVVVGLIVEADQQLRRAESAFKLLEDQVPEPHRDGFVFHATEIWSARKYRDAWPINDRMAYFKAVLGVAAHLRLGLSWSVVKRTAGSEDAMAKFPRNKERLQHVIAFVNCMWGADRFLREWAPQELGSFVAEDAPEARNDIRIAIEGARDYRVRLRENEIEATLLAESPLLTSADMALSRVRPAVQFVKKGDEILLQLADALAFAMRRFFSDLPHGDELVRAAGFDPARLELQDDEMAVHGCAQLRHSDIQQSPASNAAS